MTATRGRARLIRGCDPEIAVAPGGEILAVGPAAAAAAGLHAEVVEIEGRVLPGLSDAHLHLDGLVARRLGIDLTGARTLASALERVRRHARGLPGGAWVTGRGWNNDDWADPAWPGAAALGDAAGGRPAFLLRKDGHSAWVSPAALAAAGIGRGTADPAGGRIDRLPDGSCSGILRERAVDLVRPLIPPPEEAEYDRALGSVLQGLARLGLTSVHSMDPGGTFRALQRLRRARGLRVRVTYNLPAADLPAAERIGLRSGWGDDLLRVWGVKAFLDGSLGSRTAEMLDGRGTPVLPQADLRDLVARCARAELNVCLHAIGDGAVRRALDALQPHRRAWALWRPRIEHAQCIDPADIPRLAGIGAIASMQPIHAVADRELADREWAGRLAGAYAWGALRAAGARLAFGSDAPVEDASPLSGMDAATGWRRRARWLPELAISPAAALAAYTSGPAYAVGMEGRVGRLRPGMLADLTLMSGSRVEATVLAGAVSWRSR